MMKSLFSTSLLILAMCAVSVAQGSYKKPPANIQEILNAPAIPSTSI